LCPQCSFSEVLIDHIYSPLCVSRPVTHSIKGAPYGSQPFAKFVQLE
jgi:hypothetical protein